MTRSTTPAQRRKDELALRKIEAVQGLRDDCIGLIKQHKVTYRQVQERGGPTAQTISKWVHGETRYPQLATVKLCLNALGYDLGVVPLGEVRRIGAEGIAS